MVRKEQSRELIGQKRAEHKADRPSGTRAEKRMAKRDKRRKLIIEKGAEQRNESKKGAVQRAD